MKSKCYFSTLYNGMKNNTKESIKDILTQRVGYNWPMKLKFPIVVTDRREGLFVIETSGYIFRG